MTPSYTYRVAKVRRVVDGDTYWFSVDVGFRTEVLINVRLLGFDCPERSKGSVHERAQAKLALEAAAAFLTGDPDNLWVRTEQDPDDFGRWLGDVWIERTAGPVHLGHHLEDLSLATVWPTRWHEVYDS